MVSGSLARYVASAAMKLPALKALADTPEAFVSLNEIVGDARIVALGESFHHTHEHLLLRAIMVRYLVTALGFDTLLLEVLTPGPNALDAYVRDGADDAETALIALGARMWRNQETADLLRWLRNHNAAQPSAQVCVQGLDVLAIGPVIRRVVANVRPRGWKHLIALSRGFDIDGRADQSAYNQLIEADRAALHLAFARDGAALEDLAVRDDALTVIDALAMLKAGAVGWTEGFPQRDQAMANAVVRFLDRRPRAKAIILSHNTHIAAVASSTPPLHPPMGALLRDRYGHSYVAIGATFGHAHFDPPIYGVTDFACEPSSADHDIAELGWPAALLDLRATEQAQPLRLQGVGVGPLPYTDYPTLAAFDAIAYVDALSNASQLVESELSLDVSAVDATRR